MPKVNNPAPIDGGDTGITANSRSRIVGSENVAGQSGDTDGARDEELIAYFGLGDSTYIAEAGLNKSGAA